MACRVNRETEAGFAGLVIEYAHLRGWYVAHFRPARVRRGGVEKYETPVGADGKGFPDLVLVRDQVLFVELKSARGTLKPDQVKWVERLHGAFANAN